MDEGEITTANLAKPGGRNQTLTATPAASVIEVRLWH